MKEIQYSHTAHERFDGTLELLFDHSLNGGQQAHVNLVTTTMGYEPDWRDPYTVWLTTQRKEQTQHG